MNSSRCQTRIICRRVEKPSNREVRREAMEQGAREMGNGDRSKKRFGSFPARMRASRPSTRPSCSILQTAKIRTSRIDSWKWKWTCCGQSTTADDKEGIKREQWKGATECEQQKGVGAAVADGTHHTMPTRQFKLAAPMEVRSHHPWTCSIWNNKTNSTAFSMRVQHKLPPESCEFFFTVDFAGLAIFC